MKIRLMEKNDFKKVYAMWKKAKLQLESYEQEKKEFEDMLLINPQSCFIAINKNKVIGSVFGTYNGRWAYIYHVAVDPDWQLKGIGKLLLDNAEKNLKKKGVSKIRLTVSLDNLKVIPFYEKCGYNTYQPYSVFMSKEV